MSPFHEFTKSELNFQKVVPILWLSPFYQNVAKKNLSQFSKWGQFFLGVILICNKGTCMTKILLRWHFGHRTVFSFLHEHHDNQRELKGHILWVHEKGIQMSYWGFMSQLWCSHRRFLLLFFFCNRGDTKYHGGLRSRELCQAPMLQVPLTPRQALSSHPRPCYVFLYGRTD